MKLFLILILLSSNISADVKEFDFSRGEFELESKSGNIKIIGTEGSKVKVEYSKVKWDKSCDIAFKNKATKLEVKVIDSSFFGASDCEMNFTVSLPKTLDIEVENGSGSVSAINLLNSLDVKIGSGNLEINNSILTSVEADVGSGNIDFKGESVETDFEIGSGQIKVNLSKVNQNSKYESSQGNGSSELKLPLGITTDVMFNTGVGEIKNTTTHSSNPKLKIKVNIGSGNLNISYN